MRLCIIEAERVSPGAQQQENTYAPDSRVERHVHEADKERIGRVDRPNDAACNETGAKAFVGAEVAITQHACETFVHVDDDEQPERIREVQVQLTRWTVEGDRRIVPSA